jgi:hypothetical protein
LQETADDLQPGGRLEVPAVEEKEVDKTEQFRELFLQHEERGVPKPMVKESVKAETASSLDAMPVRELRRLAEQRGLTGTSDMKKKELVSALRQLASPPKDEKTVELQLEEVGVEELAEELTETLTEAAVLE